MFLRISFLYKLRSSRCAFKPKMSIFQHQDYFNDLINVQQRLIHKYNSVQRKYGKNIVQVV
jgi:hypothetical protein